MLVGKGDHFLNMILNITLLKDRPELLNRIDHFDRRIIIVLLKSSSSSVAIAQETHLNRKTVRARLKKLKRLGIVKERPSRNSMFCLSGDFLHALSECTKHFLRREQVL